MARTIRGSEVSTELSERHANDSQGKTSLSSTFHRNRYDARDHIFASARDNFSRPPQPGNAHYPTPDTLTILNLLSYFKICIFPADTHIFHYDTRQLGKGSTFRVQAASLPVWRARAHFRYRDPTFPRQGEKFLFTDHTQTKWKRSTIGAWKLLVHEPDLEESRDRLMGDLIKELRILSHPPLQLHPNIVHVLGFVWLQDRQFFTDDPKSDFNDARLREWPTVVTERAPHGSLREFMSDPSHTVPPTLRTKLLHCADIINGVKALHDCDIVHGDMKCDNVLIYEDSRPDTAENWQAKIADFSHSVVLNESASSDIKSSVDEAIRGTNLYHAPEISADRQVENWHNLKYVDIWCFGLLAWELMLDGTAKEESWLEDLRHASADTFEYNRTVLLDRCDRHLRSKYPQDLLLTEAVLELVGNCLSRTPTARPDAGSILEYLRNKIALQPRYGFSSLQNLDKLLPLDALPFFEISEHYYDLLATLTVPRQVCKELESLEEAYRSQSSPQLEHHLRAELQLGLCYATAFGTEADHEKAIAHISNAARRGLREARALILRAYAALGKEISDFQIPEVHQWLEDAGRGGSIMALQDLQDIAAFDNMWPGLSSSIVLDPCNATTMERLQLPSLHQAVLNANIDGILHGIDATFDVNARGQCGEVALHYTIYIRSEDGCHIAKQLLDLNADIFVETARPIVFGAQRSVLGKIDAGMSPLRVVIDHDRVDLLRIFLDSCGGPDNSRLWEMNTSILLLAVRYSSIRCLEFLCTDRNWTLYSKQHANDFDDRFFSPMYYACRPDILDRIYRFSPSRMILPAAGSSQKPLFAKDVHIIGLLRSVNASFQVHKENIFNVLHLVASFGAPETLRYLFSDREVSQLKDQKSEHGWTPLKDAIARGRYDCFCVLLENNVSMQGIWVGSGINHIHALHVCAVTPGPDAVRFAKAILSKDPQSIRAEDSEKCTPLHRAATYGRIELIELFVHHHAPIYAVNIYYRTPLGDAMVFRTIPAIRKLRYVLKQRCLPEISLQLPGILGRVVYPVAQLVTPGVHPTTGELRTSLYYRNGCADHPFSEASLSLLESLLKTSRQPWRFRVNFFQTAVYHPLYTSGIFSAIRMANLKAIQLMADSLEESSDLRASHLRHMFFQALDQLSLDEHHVADYHIRVLVVDCIWAKCVRLFDMTRNRRLASGKAAPYWRLYYILYGDKEHYQLGRCRQWIQDNPLQIYRGNMRFSYHAFTYEFHRWNDFRISPVVFTILLLVLLEIPTIIFLVIIAKDPLSGWQNYQTGLALLCGLLTNSMPTWTKTLRVAGVYYDSVQKTYDPLSKGRLLLNIGLCTVLLMVSTLNIWILFTGSYLWISYNRKLDDPFMQLPPWKRNLVYRFFSLCSAIIAWHVILIMLPVVLYLNHTILTFKVGKEAKRTPPINRRNDVEPRYKTFGTQQRLISFYPT